MLVKAVVTVQCDSDVLVDNVRETLKAFVEGRTLEEGCSMELEAVTTVPTLRAMKRSTYSLEDLRALPSGTEVFAFGSANDQKAIGIIHHEERNSFFCSNCRAFNGMDTGGDKPRGYAFSWNMNSMARLGMDFYVLPKRETLPVLTSNWPAFIWRGSYAFSVFERHADVVYLVHDDANNNAFLMKKWNNVGLFGTLYHLEWGGTLVIDDAFLNRFDLVIL